MFEHLKKLITDKNIKILVAIIVLLIGIFFLKQTGLYEGLTTATKDQATKDQTTKDQATTANTSCIKSTDKKITLSL